jgi:hypothetical protein
LIWFLHSDSPFSRQKKIALSLSRLRAGVANFYELPGIPDASTKDCLKRWQIPVQGSDRLVNRGNERKIRVGGLRILFRITSESEIAIDAILPRGDVYKHTRR